MRRQWKLYVLALSFALGAASNVRADGPTFTTIDFPGAVSTQLWGINPAGDIVGFYTLSDTSSHGFLLSGQNFTPIDFPGSAVTMLWGINAGGDIVGEYASTLTGPHTGFLRTRDGNFIPLDLPGATYTGPAGITSRGDITGAYTLPDKSTHSFLLSGGSFTTIDFPGATATQATGSTAPATSCRITPAPA
jgi:hypothetical protein